MEYSLWQRDRAKKIEREPHVVSASAVCIIMSRRIIGLVWAWGRERGDCLHPFEEPIDLVDLYRS